MSSRWRAALATTLWAFTFLFIGWPVVRVFAVSARATAVREVLGDSRIRSVAWFSLWQASLSTLVSALLAIGIAGVFSRYDFPGRRILLGFLSAPFTLPTVVVGTAFLLAAPKSLHQSAGLIIAAHVFYNVGYVTRSLLAALEELHPDVRDAAQVLGAKPAQAFLTVELPLILAPLRRVCGVVFGLCFAAYGTVLILGGPRRSTLDVEVARQALQFGRLDRAGVVAVIQFCVIVTMISLSRKNTRIDRGSGTVARPRPRAQVTRLADFVAVISTAIGVCALTFAPLVSVVKRAFRNPSGSFGLANLRQLAHVTRGSGLTETPLRSIFVSTQSALFVCVLTCVLTVLITSASTFRGAGFTIPRFARALAPTLAVGPLAISSVTLGLGVLVGFARSPVAWRSSPWMVPVVQTVICLPFSIATFVAAAQNLSTGVLEAASTLGATPFRVWRSVWLPLLRHPLRVAAGTAFAVALGEFGAASLLVLPSRETMPVVIARLAQRPGTVLNGQAAALTLILAASTALVAAFSLSGPGSLRGRHRSSDRSHHLSN
jgi:thiamine transport system permease protein